MKISAEYLKGRLDSTITENILYLPGETDLKVKCFFSEYVRFRYIIHPFEDRSNRISLNTLDKMKFLLTELLGSEYDSDVLDIDIVANPAIHILFSVPQSMFSEYSLNRIKQNYYKDIPEKYKESLKDSADNFVNVLNDYIRDNTINGNK